MSAPVTQSRNKREGFYGGTLAGKHVHFYGKDTTPGKFTIGITALVKRHKDRLRRIERGLASQPDTEKK
jgi:hypothetical protein